MSNVLINQGTQTAIKTDTVGTELYQTVKLDVGSAGASSPFTGQVSPIPLYPVLSYGTVFTFGTSGGTTVGTIIPTQGVGTAIYLTNILLELVSGTGVVNLGFGTAISGTNVIMTEYGAGAWLNQLTFPESAGMTNSPLTVTYLGPDAAKINTNASYFVK